MMIHLFFEIVHILNKKSTISVKHFHLYWEKMNDKLFIIEIIKLDLKNISRFNDFFHQFNSLKNLNEDRIFCKC